MRKIATALAVAGAFIAAPVAQAVPMTFFTNLSGPAENPPNASPGTGSATVVIDTDNAVNTLSITANWSGLVTTGTAGGPPPGTTVAHIHCCIAPPGNVGVAVTPTTLPGFPVGTFAGTYNVVLGTETASTYTGVIGPGQTTGFVNVFGGGTLPGAEAALLAGLQAGQAYFNIHSSQFPSGEIRGFLQRVPEPATLVLLGLGLLGLGLSRRKA